MYSTETAAVALGVTTKRLDNFISRWGRTLVEPGKRGRARALDQPTLEVIATALLLCRDLGMPGDLAIAFGRRLVRDGGSAHVGTLGVLSFDVARLRNVLEHTIADAVETLPPRRRGRPISTKKRGAST